MRMYIIHSALILALPMFFHCGASAGSPSESFQEIAKAKLEVARKIYTNLLQMEKQGVTSVLVNSRYTWSKRWLEADLELSNTRQRRVAAYQSHLERMTRLAEQAKRLAGSGDSSLALEAEYYRLEAMALLIRVKDETEKK